MTFHALYQTCEEKHEKPKELPDLIDQARSRIRAAIKSLANFDRFPSPITQSLFSFDSTKQNPHPCAEGLGNWILSSPCTSHQLLDSSWMASHGGSGPMSSSCTSLKSLKSACSKTPTHYETFQNIPKPYIHWQDTCWCWHAKITNQWFHDVASDWFEASESRTARINHDTLW